jgi:hypothetical protein
MLVAAGMALAPVAAHAAAADLYYERAVMAAADDRCHLFSPELASALAAAKAQARGAALRAGQADASLDQVEQRAQARVDTVACNSPDITTAAGRVRSAFAGYSQLQSMSYPGDTAEWRASRASPVRNIVWKLSQPSSFGADKAVFGLAGRDGPSVLLAVASFADGAQPFTARLVLRDRRLASSPFLNAMQIVAGRPTPLPMRLPPRFATTAVLPQARTGADALLRPAGAGSSSIAFWFPKSAADKLAGLDPREAIAIDFVFAGADGDEVRTAYFEVGDFAAGRAFLLAAQR